MKSIPSHLKKYIVEQDYEKYTPVDQAVWRYILRQLRAFLSLNAHECYLEGLEKTGIQVEEIPRISTISDKLEKFGWRALAVSGFIPPAAFMELQSLGVLPIASDMRTLEHLRYTPAPDIVHEAAGHAPILIHPEFAEYLRQYSQVARKAIISSEDLSVYEGIRNLSDLKEDPQSTPEQVQAAQVHLNAVSSKVSLLSEAAELARMNWWTAEYGLIGDLDSPKIFGAGLLSSVGESRWCLGDKVKKIPLSLNCIKTGYDITEPQPQLFVAPDFKSLTQVLQQMAEQMAFKTGGINGLTKAKVAKTVNTVQLNSRIQISGKLEEFLSGENNVEIAYLKFSGPCQLSYKEYQLSGHGVQYHAHGFGTALGSLKEFENKCLSELSKSDLAKIGVAPGDNCCLRFQSGVEVAGKFKSEIRKDGRLLVLSFSDCRVTLGSRVLFEPNWGVFDLAVGSVVSSVFGGPADREAFGEAKDFFAKKVPDKIYSDKHRRLHQLYRSLRQIREKSEHSGIKIELEKIRAEAEREFPDEWLLYVECLELAQGKLQDESFSQKIKSQLKGITQRHPELNEVIQDGLELSNQL